MREINVNLIKDKVKEMCISSNYNLGNDVMTLLKKYKEVEESDLGVNVLDTIIDNANIAQADKVAMCQDTGLVTVYLELGQEVKLVGGNLTHAINQGVREGYEEGYLRKSIVKCPFDRVNTKDNTPAIIHYDIIDGDKINLKVAPKGFGSENMSAIGMLKPSQGIEGAIDFVVETVSKAGPNPCPPIIVGVGAGGNFEKAAYLAKKALTRSLDDSSDLELIKKMEEICLKKINDLGIGPMGLGGNTTALAVKVETHPTHIAGMPVAVAINCHATRHEECTI